jgi:hypothetical protein
MQKNAKIFLTRLKMQEEYVSNKIHSHDFYFQNQSQYEVYIFTIILKDIQYTKFKIKWIFKNHQVSGFYPNSK